jgi:hypothetical protein
MARIKRLEMEKNVLLIYPVSDERRRHAHSSRHIGSVGVRHNPGMAVQPELGLLSQRLDWNDSSSADRADITWSRTLFDPVDSRHAQELNLWRGSSTR